MKSRVKFEAIKGFYKGLRASLIRVVPACMITFVVYEKVSHLMLYQDHQIVTAEEDGDSI